MFAAAILVLIPEPSQIGPLTFVVYPIVLGGLMVLSTLFVGSGAANFILEGSLCAFALLISLSRTPILSQFALNTLNAVIIAAGVGSLVEWIHSESREERIKYGRPPENPDEFSGIFYAGISYGYILFGFLTLISLYGNL
jgi:hypothetical protein